MPDTKDSVTSSAGGAPDSSRPSSSASGPSGQSAGPQASSTSSGTPAGGQPSTAPGAAGLGGGLTGQLGAAQQMSKRRRGHGVVTPTACTECRKKRAKCDGGRPCGRCASQKDVKCVYEFPVRQSKEDLRSEIEQLRQRQRSNDQVFAALIRPDLWQEVLHRLRGGQSVDAISDWLGSALPSFSRPLDAGAAVGHGRTMPPLAFGAPGPGSVSSLNLGMGPGPSLSPIVGHPPGPLPPPPPPPTQPQQGHIPLLRSTELEHSHPSPWNFSSHSQSGVSTASEPHAGLMDWTPDVHARSRAGSWVETSSQTDQGSRYRWLDQVLSPLDAPEIKAPAASWTDIASDVDLVQHLLALYFCWEYPTFASLSKEHFLKDFKDGTRRYCSSMLVNALLALGCRFSTKPNTRANQDDPHTSGDHFFKESLRLYHLEQDHRSLTTIQALGIMAIREASCGRDSESWYYAGQSIRIAIEMGLHMNDGTGDEDEVAVQAATFWGAFALDHAWSLATGSLPQSSSVLHLPPKPAIIDDIESSLWIPYTDDGVPLQRSCEQPSNVRSVYKCFCELSELVHQSLYILHSPGRPLTSRDLLGIYTQYLDWYDRIPVVLRLGHNFTPAVLFAHMYYHFAILLLFRPLIKLRIVGSKVSPRDVCSQAADAIQGLLRSYSQLYTLRRTPSFVPYFVLTSAIMHMAIAASSPTTAVPQSAASQPQQSSETTPSAGDAQRRDSVPPGAPASKDDPRVFKAIRQGIADLTEMAPCHHFAQQALNILRYLANKWNLDVDTGRNGNGGAKAEEGKGKEKEKKVEADVDNLVKPNTDSLNFFAPNVQIEDVICAWGTGGGSVIPRTQDVNESRGNPRDNPLFWPFPFQGRPMLPSGKELEEAGFVVL